MNYQSVANSATMLILCAIPILLVLAQSFLFMRIGMKRTKELGMSKTNVNKAITNSAIFSILPSLPIVISMAALMPALGKYIPWLRLSVIGSVAYETMCADMTMQAFGYTGMGDTSMVASVFISVIWVMCVVSCVWPLTNIIGLKFYDKKLKSAQKSSGSGGFMKVAAAAMFVGLMCVMFIPRTMNQDDPVGLITCLVAGASVLIIDQLAKEMKIKALSDFSFPIAMIFGMAAACFIS